MLEFCAAVEREEVMNSNGATLEPFFVHLLEVCEADAKSKATPRKVTDDSAKKKDD